MSGFLENIRDTVGGVFHSDEGESVLGVDISSSTMKVVQLKKKNERAILETYGELALGPYANVGEGQATRLDQDVMVGALKDLIKEAKVSTTNCGVAIPLSSSLINVIQMPDVGERKLKEMIPIEMRKYVPVSISEVMLDWRIIPKKENEEENSGTGKRDVVEALVVAIHKDTTKRYQEIIKEAGLSPTFFEIEVFSSLRAILSGTGQPSAVVDFGAGTTKVYISEDRILRESHVINRGSQDITLALSKSLGVSYGRANELKHTIGLSGGEENKNVSDSIVLALDVLLSEVSRTLRQYQQKNRKNIGLVVLSGGGALLKGLEEKAKERFETDVMTADPFSRVVAPAFLEDVLKDAGPEFAVSVGVALRKLEEED